MRLLCALALISAVLRAQTIEGTATDALTGLPLPGVAIHLYKTGGMPAREAVTDSLGRFRIEGLSEGGYYALIRKEGYSDRDANETAGQHFRLPKGAEVRLDARMAPLGTVSGRVLGADDRPISGTPPSILKSEQAFRPVHAYHMSTLRQIEANRRNAQKSTGPTSVTGKAASSMNALKTGIHAKSLVLSSEKLADLEQLIGEHYHRHQPASPEARDIVDDLIYCEWTLRRLRVADTEMWRYQNDDIFRDPEKNPLGKSATCNPTAFSKLQYRLDATRRARLRALQALAQLKPQTQAESEPGPALEPVAPPSPAPSPQTTSPQIGFVLPNPSAGLPELEPADPNPTISSPHGRMPQEPPTATTGRDPQGKIKNCLISS